MSTLKATNLQHASATSPNITLGSDGSVAVGGGNISPQTGFKNRIINSGMRIAQRGTSFSLTGGNVAWLADRFNAYINSGSSVTATVSQQSDAPTGFNNSGRVTIGTADATVIAGRIIFVEQVIEGYNIADLVGNSFTLSFWVRSAKTGTHCVAFRNGAANLSYVAQYAVNTANTWEFKTVTVSGGIPNSGTWDFVNGAGLHVRWALAAGTDFQTTAGSWNSGNFVATSSQVNVADTTNNIFALSGVQLEKGSVATPFEFRSIGQELALCQRYYAKSYDIAAIPGSSSTNGLVTGSIGAPNSTSLKSTTVFFQVSMRTTPTITTYDVVGNINKCSLDTIGAFVNNIACSVYSIGEKSMSVFQNTGTNGAAISLHYTSSAEL